MIIFQVFIIKFPVFCSLMALHGPPIFSLHSSPNKKWFPLELVFPKTQIRSYFLFVHVCAKSLQSCATLCNPMARSPPGSSVHVILQARTGVGCHALLQGIFWPQGLNPQLIHLLHWQTGSLPLVLPGKQFELLYFKEVACTGHSDVFIQIH